jgi:hypothetical protein
MIKKTKPDNVEISTGATVEVTVGGEVRRFSCGGSNEVNEKTVAEILKSVKDCVEKGIKKKGRPLSKK